METDEVKEYWESRTGQPYGPGCVPSGTQVEVDENAIIYTPTPVAIYSLCFDAEQLLTVYGALRTYLKVLSGQESEDLEAIERTVKIMIQVKPRAVEASKSLALKAVGMKNAN